MNFPIMGVADIQRLRDALIAADYTTAGLEARLGSGVTARCGLIHPDTAMRAAHSDDPLSVFMRLFLAKAAVPRELAARAMDLSPALESGLLVESGEGGAAVAAGMQLHPYRDWWILADLSPHWTGRSMRPDHVLCAGPASVSVAGAVIRERVGTALDIGTGGGVQALHLSSHADRVTGTDLSPRALRFAATTALLNGLEWELLHGDLVAPVRGRRFDLVISNPPYVLSPGSADFLYRDSGRPGDAISKEIVGAAPGLLTEGGYLQTMASWAQVHGEEWTERVAQWLPSGMDAWVVQTAQTDVKAYVDHWAGETGAEDVGQKAAWLEWLTSKKVEAVGTGLITLRNSGAAQPVIRLETLYQQLDSPLGDHILSRFERLDWLGRHDLLEGRFAAARGMTLWQRAENDTHGWDLRQQTVSMQSGLRWQEHVTQLVVSVLGACQGDRPLHEVLSELTQREGVAAEEAFAEARRRLPLLVERGMLLPVS